MTVNFKLGGKSYSIDFSEYYDLSIPVNFNGLQPNTYNVEKATSSPVSYTHLTLPTICSV